MAPPLRSLDTVVRLLGPRSGLLCRAAALDAGIDDRALDAAVRRQVLTRVRRGYYASSEAWRASSAEQRHLLEARAVLAGLRPDAYLADVTALVAHGSDLWEPDLSTVHLLRAGSAGRREGGCSHSDGELPDAQRQVVGGLRTCSAARALVDYARDPAVTLDQAVVAMDSLLHAGATSVEELERIAEAVRGWSGSRSVVAAVHRTDGRAESVGESLSRLRLSSAGVPPDELQVIVLTERGEARVDFGWLRWRVVGEFDGKVKYGRLLRPGESQSDVAWAERLREQALERAGWVVVRFRWADLEHPERMRRRVEEAARHAVLRGLVPAV